MLFKNEALEDRLNVSIRLLFLIVVLLSQSCATSTPSMQKRSAPMTQHRSAQNIPLQDVQVEPLQFTAVASLGLTNEFAFIDGKTAESLSFEQVLARGAQAEVFLVGEQHNLQTHHQLQAALLRGLARKKVAFRVGMEMVSADKQPILDRFNVGELDEITLPEALNWKKSWGHDYDVYLPVFIAARELNIELMALNVPRDWVRALRQKSFEKQSLSLQAQLPEMDLTDLIHKREIMGFLEEHHPKMGRTDAGKGFYRVQVLWDEGMAENAFRCLQRAPKKKLLLMAGNGHISGYRAIPDRLARRLSHSLAKNPQILTLVPLVLEKGEPALAAVQKAVAAQKADILAVVKAVKVNEI